MQIRTATVLDLSALYGMLHVMHKESEHTVSSINSEKGTAAISAALHRGVVLVAEVDGKVVGSIGGMETSDWWSTDKTLADLWLGHIHGGDGERKDDFYKRLGLLKAGSTYLEI